MPVGITLKEDGLVIMAKKFVKAMDSQHFGDVVEASKGKKSLISLFSLLMSIT